MGAVQTMRANTFDPARISRVSDESQGAGFTRPCVSYGADPWRWFCLLVAPRCEVVARDALDAAGFGAFVPLVTVIRRHARREEARQVPAFPRYLFARLDLSTPGWTRVYRLPRSGVLRVIGARPEAPTPLPVGAVERLQAAGWDRPIGEDLAPALLEAGADVRVTDGPLVDQLGVCQWSDGTRVRVLLSLLGRQVPTMLPLHQVARA
jgi:transcriptional antiterminator RfaH